METLMILVAASVAVFALAMVWAMSARARRPPLRTRREQDIADRLAGGDEEALVASLKPAPASPIDRAATVLDARSIETALIEGRVIDDVRYNLIDGEPAERESAPAPKARADRAAEPRGRKAR